VEYIKNTIDIFVNQKVEEELNFKLKKDESFGNFEFEDNCATEYEKLLRKLEADIRVYIQNDLRSKLEIETLYERIGELENEKGEIVWKYNKLQEHIQSMKSSDVENYKKQIDDLTAVVRTYEEHNLKIPILEKKLRAQKSKYESEIKALEESYKQKLDYMDKKLEKFEDRPLVAKAKVITKHEEDDQVNVSRVFI
jgi:hypothetical protein